jgi:predicted Zn-dependent protease
MNAVILHRWLRAVCALPLLALALAGVAAAIPYIPADGKKVVEHLPSRTDPVQRELMTLRAELSKNPDDVRLASALAQRYIEQARTEGDPRYLGYAQAALAPWWKLPHAPDEVLVLRATLRQSTHQFGAALADLDTVLKRDINNAQAWLTRATVQMVIGDFAAARRSCMRLYTRAPELVVQTCLSNVGSLNGDAKRSYASLEAALERHRDADRDVRGWVQTLLAEMAARLGDDAAADRYFRQAMAAGEPDSYLLAAYADFMLDRGRAPEVVRLLKDKGRIDALLLRYAIALKSVRSPEAPAQAEALRSRFDAAMLRGDTVHQREQARFELVLRNDPRAAARLAKLNWAVQKEPADLRILAESAAASGDKEAAQLALDWIASTRLEDQAIAAPLAKLRAQSKAPA